MQESLTRRNTRQKTAAQRYATRQGSKRAKILVVGIIAFFVVLILVIEVSTYNMFGGSYEEAVLEPAYEQNADVWEEEEVKSYLGAPYYE